MVSSGSPAVAPINPGELDDQLIEVTVAGGVNLPAPAAGTLDQYAFQVQCKELDDDSNPNTFNDWWFIKGNVNAVSTRAT